MRKLHGTAPHKAGFTFFPVLICWQSMQCEVRPSITKNINVSSTPGCNSMHMMTARSINQHNNCNTIVLSTNPKCQHKHNINYDTKSITSTTITNPACSISCEIFTSISLIVSFLLLFYLCSIHHYYLLYCASLTFFKLISWSSIRTAQHLARMNS